MKVLVAPFDYARAQGITKQGLYWRIDNGKVETVDRPSMKRYIVAESEDIPEDVPTQPYFT